MNEEFKSKHLKIFILKSEELKLSENYIENGWNERRHQIKTGKPRLKLEFAELETKLKEHKENVK